MVVLLATGLVPAAVAGCWPRERCRFADLSVEQVYRAVNWTTVILIGALMPLSFAMEQDRAARLLAEALGRVPWARCGLARLQAGLFRADVTVPGRVISTYRPR